MYNQDIKERFLEHEKLSKSMHTGAIFSVFEKLSSAEEKIGKDIFQMSENEFVSAINELWYTEYGTIAVVVSDLRKYAQWCVSTGVFDTEPGYIVSTTPSDVDPTAAISRTFFRDEADFLATLSQLRDMSGGFSEVAMALLAWCGITAKEAYDLKDECVDLEAGVIRSNSGNILVSYIAPDIKEVLLQYRNTAEAPRSNGRSTYMVYRDNSADTFIRRFYTKNSAAKGTPVSYNQLTKALSNLTKQAESLGLSKQFTQLNLSRSGYLHRILELEQEGLDLSSYEGKRTVCDLARGTDIYAILWQYRYYKKAFNF